MSQLRSSPFFFFFLLLFLVLFLSAAQAFSVKDWSSSLYGSVRQEAEKSFSALFNQPVKIERAGGILVGRIELIGVTFPGLGRADKITLSYNPLSYALAKGDIIKALTRITVSGGDFQVTRDRRGRWSVLSLVSQNSDGAGGPPPFAGRLVLQDCRIKYLDEAGFRSAPERFAVEAEKVTGRIDLRKNGRIDFTLAARLPERVKVNGSFNQKNGKFLVQVTADKLSAAKWVNYTVPLPGLNAREGLVDVAIKLTPARTRGWPVALGGKFTLHDASAGWQDHQAAELNGTVQIVDDKITFSALHGEIDTLPVTVNGRLSGFTAPIADLNIVLADGDLRQMIGLVPQLKEIDLNGKGAAVVKISGPLLSPLVNARVGVTRGALYGQQFRGNFNLSLADNQLQAESADLALYRGRCSFKATVGWSGARPRLQLAGRFYLLDLAALAQGAPGMEGKASGSLTLDGPFNDLRGSLTAGLTGALVLGQPLDRLETGFTVKDNDFQLDKFQASGADAGLNVQGKITRDLNCSFLAAANGLRLSGRGSFGKMHAALDSFKGTVDFRLAPQFFAAPLKNLKATGEIKLSRGAIGEQRFDRADGKISLGGGEISADNVTLRNGSSLVTLNGKTGLGLPTELKITGNPARLEELQILNAFLPEELRNPTGAASLEVTVSGLLPAESDLSALEPLFDLSVRGRFLLLSGEVAGVPISYARAALTWEGRSLSLSDTLIIMPSSSLQLDLDLKNDGRLSGLVKGVADLSLFRRLTSKYGQIGGEAGFSLLLAGSVSSPEINSSFWLNRCQLNELYFDRVAGGVDWRGNRLTVSQPIIFFLGQDRYSLGGDFSAADLNAELKIERADIGSAYNLYTKAEAEFFRRFAPPAGDGKAVPDLSGFRLPSTADFATDQGAVKMYRAEGRDFFLQDFAPVRRSFEKQLARSPAENLSGLLSGEVTLSGRYDDLSGRCSAQLSKGALRDYQFDSLSFAAELAGQKLTIDQAVLRKKEGTLAVKGGYSLSDNELSLDLAAASLPVDILGLLFPGKKYSGAVDLQARIDGPPTDPGFTVAASGKGISLAGIDFSRIDLAAAKKGRRLDLRSLSLNQNGVISRASGHVDLQSPGEIDLETDLRGNAIGLLNLFTDQAEWRRGSSMVKLKMTGSLERPKINGRLAVNKGTIFVKALDSELHDLQGTASIESNLLIIQRLTGIWQGRRTRDLPNPLGLAGTIDLSRSLAADARLDLNLALSSSKVYVAFPNLYVGVLAFKDVSLTGPLYFDQSKGPLLKGKAEIDDAVITISPPGQGGKAFPLGFDLEANLNKNVYATMGDVATLNLSNILMNLEIAGSGLKIAGRLDQPVMRGDVAVKRGTVNIFNREFSLLNAEQQKKYYPYDAEKVQNNKVVFKGEEGAAGAMPELNITANVVVENTEKDAAGNSVKKPVNILAQLKGTIGAREETQGLKIALAGFTEDKSKSPAEMAPAKYSEQDLKVMLLPDFIKSLAGIGRPEGGQTEAVNTNAVVADYLNSRVQTLLFRGLEREVESKLGLESLTLEYNFGPQFREVMGVRDVKGFETEKPAWSVGFVKGFFDRLYIDVRYSQSMEQPPSGAGQGSAAAASFNYQLTYKLNPIWSILYYREPISMQQISTGYSKLTLKAGFSFW